MSVRYFRKIARRTFSLERQRVRKPSFVQAEKIHGLQTLG